MEDEIKIESKPETGTKNLLYGTGLGAMGTCLALGAGYICPVCVIGTPLLLSIGAVQKYKYTKRKHKNGNL